MFKEVAKRSFSNFFLFIFFAKMVISVAPLFFGNLDGKSLYSVIMQIEIEHQTPKGSEAKLEEIQTFHQHNISRPLLEDGSSTVFSYMNNHVQSFYPSVPTPPPNA